MSANLAPDVWNHDLIIGDTYQPIGQALVDEDGAVPDLDGATGELQIRTEDLATLLLDVLEEAVSIDTVTGIVTWTATADATAALSPNPTARYSLRLTWPDATVRTVLEGRVNIRRSVVA